MLAAVAWIQDILGSIMVARIVPPAVLVLPEWIANAKSTPFLGKTYGAPESPLQVVRRDE